MERSGLTLDSTGRVSAGLSRVMLKPGSKASTPMTVAAPAAAIPMVTLRLMPLGFGDRGRKVAGAGDLGVMDFPLSVSGSGERCRRPASVRRWEGFDRSR